MVHLHARMGAHILAHMRFKILLARSAAYGRTLNRTHFSVCSALNLRINALMTCFSSGSAASLSFQHVTSPILYLLYHSTFRIHHISGESLPASLQVDTLASRGLRARVTVRVTAAKNTHHCTTVRYPGPDLRSIVSLSCSVCSVCSTCYSTESTDSFSDEPFYFPETKKGRESRRGAGKSPFK